jgi:hypothetical protein
MRSECIEAVGRALGRSLTQAEAQDIENRILGAMRKQAQEDTAAWRAMSTGDRLEAAAQRAAQDVATEAALKRRRIALTALRHDAVRNYLMGTDRSPAESLERLLAFYSDGKSGTISVESAAQAIREDALGAMLDVFDVTRGKMLGLFTDQAGVLDLVRELRGQKTGNAEAAQAAQSFREVAESLRQRFNRGGGNIGRLEDWGMPQSHSQLLVARAGQDAWVADHLGWVDRSRYTNPDGSIMDENQVRDFLGAAYETLSTNGANKLEPGRPTGNGMRANRGSAERQIHYRDAESYLAAQAKYSDTPMLQTLVGHVDRLSRDIALVEALGPNPNQMFRYWSDWAKKTMAERDRQDEGKINAHISRLQTLYDEVSGSKRPPASVMLAKGFDTYRALNVAARLGSSVLTSITDVGTMAVTAVHNGIPLVNMFANELRSLNPASSADRRMALRAGLGVQQFIGAVNRWGTDGLAQDAQVSGRVARYAQGAAAAVLKFSGLNALTGAGQQAFGAVLMDSLGSLTRGTHDIATLAAVKGGDGRLARRLRDAGITEHDFAVWKAATPEDWRGMGDSVLTAESIYRIPDADLAALSEAAGMSPTRLREQAATHLMGYVAGETNMAVVEPGARDRVSMYGGMQRGKPTSEMWRSVLQFKGFPLAAFMRHGARAMARSGAVGKGVYIAEIVATTTVLGAVALQLSEVASGRDPQDMTTGGFWARSFLKGGALGIYGDFLFADWTKYGTSIGGTLGGPIVGDIEDVLKLTMGSAERATDGGDTKAGPQAIKMLKGHLPGANLWYTKAALDRLIFSQLQEMAAPGYSQRMEARARKQFNESYYWHPGQTTPQRGPDLGRAVGE